MIPVILSGGSGTRLWPLSRKHYPKQLLPLINEDSTMLQDTYSRLVGVPNLQAPLVICNDNHRFMVAEQLRQLGSGHQGILLEPVGRNTAPAITAAALQLEASGQADALMLVLPADHCITDLQAFHSALASAKQIAEQDALVTFGIVPNQPETGYGYIQRGQATSQDSSAYSVSAFVEKPDLPTAQAYLAGGQHYWNSGMFLFKASRLLSEIARFEPAMLDACRTALENSIEDLDFIRLDSTAFATCKDISIDYAVMEKTDQAIVVPLDAGWNDVGSWSALWEVSQRGEDGNATFGDVMLEQSRNCFVHAGSRLVTTLGVENLVVVETADAVMVAAMDRVQDVKKLVDRLAQQGRDEALQHREVYRPWGSFDGVDRGDRYQVKRLTVNPGSELSLQRHFHRAEHWVVVQGTAKVTRNDDEFLVAENESVYLPLGCIHKLENPGKIPLHLIEIQTGAYLGEDDIVRLEDPYHRDSSS